MCCAFKANQRPQRLHPIFPKPYVMGCSEIKGDAGLSVWVSFLFAVLACWKEAFRAYKSYRGLGLIDEPALF